MSKLLWVGDAGCPSGFAVATHKILDVLRHSYDVTVLGINYRGDPHSYPYPIYAAAPTGDAFGLGRLIWMCDLVKPDVVVLQNDPWNIRPYLRLLEKIPEYMKVPVVGSIAVDGKNCQSGWLDGLSHCVFWTQFGLDEARAGNYEGPATVIPLGVDVDVYHPMDKLDARLQRGLPRQLDDAFIVGNVNRNQPRKRWDLTIKYFAEWIKTKKIDDAYLYLHVAPTGDTGVDVKQLAFYYGVIEKLVLVEPQTWYGIPEQDMVLTYNCFDVAINTGQGEGMGLTALEAMACGIPCILGDWSALGDWAKGSAWLIPCTSTAIGPPYVNVIGGVPDQTQFIGALNTMYRNKDARRQNSVAAFECAQQPRFRWENVGKQFAEVLSQVLLTEEVTV